MHGEWSLAKPLQTSHAIWDNLDLISFRGKKPLQNLPQSTIVLDDQNPIHCGWSQFGHWSVQSCCQGSGSHKLFLFSRIAARFILHLHSVRALLVRFGDERSLSIVG